MKKEKPLPIRLYEEYMKRFDEYTDQEIINAFNKEAGNCGWGTARASYLGALHKQLDKRKFNYSQIGDKESMSLKKKIKLEGKDIKITEEKLDINPSNGLWKVIPDKNDPSGYKVERVC